MDADLFSGPGGWCQAARTLGLAPVGFELDAAACATRAAAGHRTVRADVAQMPAERLPGKIRGLIGSPPCTTFSAAGKRAGAEVLHILEDGIRDALGGRPARAARRREMARALRVAWWPGPKLTREQRAAKIRAAVLSASLVIEPARFIHACHPEWVAMEQVPSVLPLWQVYAAELRKAGYSVWCGTLNSADYGVPQTRIRAILIASRMRIVERPYPTHYDPRKGAQLFGTPWISMADALGWGANGRPGPAVTAGGTSTGGAEPFPTRARELLEDEQEAGRWVLRRQVGASLSGSRRDHPLDEPAPTITGGGSAAGSGNGAGLQWVLHTNRDQRQDGSRQVRDPRSAPALTAKSGGQWVLRAGNQARASERPAPAPAPTIAFGHAAASMTWIVRTSFGKPKDTGGTHEMDPAQRPAHAVTGKAKDWVAWVQERPATTVQGDPRVGRPGHKERANGGESQFAQDSVRITVREAAILQSFPPDYPWAGSKTKQYEQVGNAIPPLLALHVLAMASGVKITEAAA